MKKYYLSYGSNLNLMNMCVRCPEAKVLDKLVLENYRLVYRGGMDEFAYLTIEPGEGFYVPLGLYEISTQDEINLDVYEGYPNLYEKEYLQIEYNGQKVDALIYVMKDNFSYHRPSKIYIETCEEGYLDFGFDKSILDEALKYSLKNIPDTLKRGL